MGSQLVLSKEKCGFELSQAQVASFQESGFLHIPAFFSAEEVTFFKKEISRIEQMLFAQGVDKLNGIPIYWGIDPEGRNIAHRMPFLSHFSNPLAKLINTPKFQVLAQLLGKNGRIGDLEKDGMVLNQYTYNHQSKFKSMGWHTDSLRDVFYFRKVYPMLNIGIHLTDTTPEVGKLHVLPGSHKQGLWALLTRKLYYLNNTKDESEVTLFTMSGDLTIHHGHIWHRVSQPVIAKENTAIRKVIYLPVLCDPIQVKHARSKTPLYHRFQKLYR